MRRRIAAVTLLLCLACAGLVAALSPSVKDLMDDVARRPARSARGFWDALTKPLPSR